MNKPIRVLSLFCLVLFLLLLGNATYLQYFRSGELNDDPNNRRVIQAAFSRERGAILVGREPIAESVPSNDQYEYQRKYDSPLTYAHLTGYFSYFSQTGLELTQNQILSGDDPSLFVTRLIDMLSQSSPKGGNVQLTIDPDAQRAAFEGIAGLGEGTEGAVVALEPSTGKILAMVSSPSFDPNRLADHDLGNVSDAYKELDKGESKPLLNRAIQTTLPPGSTFKLVTAAAALESGKYSADSLVPGGSSYQLPQSSTSIGNHDGGDCGGSRITMTQALDVSCNVTFLSLADQLGNEEMKKVADRFGFNDDSYLEDLPNLAASRYPSSMDEPQTAMSGIGQSEVASTPLQMAMVAAAIANDGTVMKPYLVDEVRSPNMELLKKHDPQELTHHAISPSTARELSKMMVSVVDNGTGSAAQIPGMQVGGKTGTAQSTEDRPPYAWFVSQAPADDPKVAIAVVVESANIGRSEIAGGALGGPIAKGIIEAVTSNE